MHYEIIITFILSSLALTISPGPDILYVISQSFIKGKKQAIITSLGLTTGLLFHTFQDPQPFLLILPLISLTSYLLLQVFHSFLLNTSPHNL